MHFSTIFRFSEGEIDSQLSTGRRYFSKPSPRGAFDSAVQVYTDGVLSYTVQITEKNKIFISSTYLTELECTESTMKTFKRTALKANLLLMWIRCTLHCEKHCWSEIDAHCNALKKKNYNTMNSTEYRWKVASE